MDKYLSPLISAYRQSYSTKHVLICLLEEWIEGLDNNFVVRGVFINLFKAFDCIPMIYEWHFSTIVIPSKTMRCFLFHLKSSFHSRDIYIFVFPSSSLYLPVSHCFRA